ncbi:MAG: ribosome-associated translation inhibitor RaiA [Calditrichales bacterium]|nr:MAG: ribosome-associated translation inhibitor RaiA [Calditrichales bacterium]
MNISITARGGKAPDRLKKYVTDKLARKERLYEGVIDVEITFSYEKQTQIAEVKMKLSNNLIIAREKSEEIYKSIDLVLDNCERQIKRVKERQREHTRDKINDKIAV